MNEPRKYTRLDIWAMSPPELSEIVAIEIMGKKPMIREGSPCPYCGDSMRHGAAGRSRCSTCNEWRYSPYKDYAQEIESAWEVMEELNKVKDPENNREDYLTFTRFSDSLNDHVNFASLNSTDAAEYICRYAVLAKLNL